MRIFLVLSEDGSATRKRIEIDGIGHCPIALISKMEMAL
ncbi:hypothetical protein CEV32_3283 [Brucella rhizosphaerae]|uniref:Uncharacterized protein n=1 Tax=Brucella rhizosphaerae TaxID=571254 RepID=A0A256FUJ1_9HYPH|nr:hypothetical protein CEV32_3283 [Brucella rhizosphaerae]